MTVSALGNYEFAARDAQANFKGRQVLYVNWEKHTLFARPLCVALTPETPFRYVLEEVIPEAYSQHPEFERIDWQAVQWIKSGQAWCPDPGKSLVENGLMHKDLIRMVTPGLDGLNGMGI